MGNRNSGRNKIYSILRESNNLIPYTDEYGKIVNMSWNDFGNGPKTWQVDHIVALMLFNLNNKDEQLIANHWTNLQPLWFHDHVAKSKLDMELKKYLNIDNNI